MMVYFQHSDRTVFQTSRLQGLRPIEPRIYLALQPYSDINAGYYMDGTCAHLGTTINSRLSAAPRTLTISPHQDGISQRTPVLVLVSVYPAMWPWPSQTQPELSILGCRAMAEDLLLARCVQNARGAALCPCPNRLQQIDR